MTGIRTTCPYCGVGCGVLMAPDGQGGGHGKGRSRPSGEFRAAMFKRRGPGETLGLEGCILSPLVGGKAASWDAALTLVAERFQTAIRNHGPDSVAFYLSGQMLTEDYYIANKLIKGYMGTANVETNSRLCMASSVAGHKRAFGADTVPGTYEELDQADLVVLVGSNLAWCNPVLYQRLVASQSAGRFTTLTTAPASLASACAP